MADVLGTRGDDFIHSAGDGLAAPPGANDIPAATAGDDTIRGLGGFDTIFAGDGNDTALFNVDTDRGDTVDLGAGADVVEVSATTPVVVRLTFTSGEVGNGDTNDSGTVFGQDGGLAVRLRSSDEAGMLVGPLSRFDDEGITFVSSANVTFNLRDLAPAVQLGLFRVASFGSAGDNLLSTGLTGSSHYLNGGVGDDTLEGGDEADLILGGAGEDVLRGFRGRDTLVGGGSASDTLEGGAGRDTASIQFAAGFSGDDGADTIDLGGGRDVINVRSAAISREVRLTFTFAEVGDGRATDSGTVANQDGGLAVRMQEEQSNGGAGGPIVRTDDEGISFVGQVSATFDVRDLGSNVSLGNFFNVVQLGSAGDDKINPLLAGGTSYVNGGAGDDKAFGSISSDLIVGGSGNDDLRGSGGDDTLIGQTGDDRLIGNDGNDTVRLNVSTDGADRIGLGDGMDTVDVSSDVPGEVRLTLSSSEVGNGDPQRDRAVRLQAEDGSDGLTGPTTRADDEGITLRAGAGVTFDVRDPVSGARQGDVFKEVVLGTVNGDELNLVARAVPILVDAGMGDDSVTAGSGADVLVGGMGNDSLYGRAGNDTYVVDPGDLVVEAQNQGTDTVLSAATLTLGANIENLTLTSTDDVAATGNALGNTITGNSGGNVINGLLGSDVLFGGAGADDFAFSARPGADNIDVVADFVSGTDRLVLSSAAFGSLPVGPLDAELFAVGTASEADDRVVLASDGTVLFDSDGSGTRSAIAFATIGAGTALTADDILVVA